MIDIVKVVLFSLFINWCISLQILNQNLPKSFAKFLAIFLAIALGASAGIILIL
jgi:hypothetical protein